MNRIDIDDARILLNNLLFFAMHRPEARDKGAFKYVSADWIDLPGWFFWPKNRTGVFLLKLKDNVSSHRNPGGETFCSLYYYPSLDEPVFEKFSCLEQLVRTSDLFSRSGVDFSTECPHCECNEANFKDLQGGKGIPTPEARQQISSELFAVGEIMFGWENDQLISIKAEAPCHDRTWAKTAVDIPTETGMVHLLDRDALDRDLPCWELTEQFTDNLTHFLPVDIIHSFANENDESAIQVSYDLKQILCRTTGALVE